MESISLPQIVPHIPLCWISTLPSKLFPPSSSRIGWVTFSKIRYTNEIVMRAHSIYGKNIKYSIKAKKKIAVFGAPLLKNVGSVGRQQLIDIKKAPRYHI